jgi:hypothetical protein
MKYFKFEKGVVEEEDMLDCLDQLKEGGADCPRCEISVRELKETIDVLGFSADEVRLCLPNSQLQHFAPAENTMQC